MSDIELKEKIKILLDNKKYIEYNDIYKILLDEKEGVINNYINDINQLKKINNIIKILIKDDIEEIYNEIYK